MKKIILSAVAFIGALSLNAQDEAPKLSVSGTVDAYYQSYLTASDDCFQALLELRLLMKLDLL